MPLNSAQETWQAALGALQLQITRPNFETWLKETRGLSVADGTFKVGVPNAFVGEWLNTRLRQLISTTLAGILGQAVAVEFVTFTPAPEAPRPLPVQSDGGVTARIRPPAMAGPRLNRLYTFENFVVGDCNRLPYSTALDIVENPGHGYNPLFIYGGTGLGKTHLLHAVGHAAAAGHMRAVYLTAEQFTNDFVTAIKARRADEFRQRFHDAEVFLLDDVQFMAGREGIQECLLHTFIDLYNNSCRIVLAADRPPAEIPHLDSRLCSRFAWGLVARLEAPAVETRLAILQAKSGLKGYQLEPASLQRLAERSFTNIRELEGLLNQFHARARLNGTSLAHELTAPEPAPARTADVPPAEVPAPGTLTAARVVELAAQAFNLKPAALTGPGRDRAATGARQVAMYLLQEGLKLGPGEAGRALGDRDHSTVIYGVRKVRREIAADPALRLKVNALMSQLGFSTTAPTPPPSVVNLNPS